MIYLRLSARVDRRGRNLLVIPTFITTPVLSLTYHRHGDRGVESPDTHVLLPRAALNSRSKPDELFGLARKASSRTTHQYLSRHRSPARGFNQ